MTTIAFIGLGRMGRPMAANLVKAGFDVIAYNRTQTTAQAFADQVGATVAANPRQAAERAEVIITMLADERSLRAVYDGPVGVLNACRPGLIAIDMGTTGPAGVGRLGMQIAATGAQMVDAPVSGSTAAAEAGTLTILAGGPPEALDAVHPVLLAMGSTIYRLGPLTAGQSMKLAVNAVIFALGGAVSEALVLAERAGIDRQLAYEVFENSAIAAPMVKYRHGAFIDPDNTPAAFALTLAAKDLGLIQELAQTVGAPMPQSVVNAQVIDAAVARGLGDRDMAAVAVYLRESAGT